MWRCLESETVHHCLFQYALTGRSDCEGCGKKVEDKALRAKIENGTKFYHFECFWRYETTAKCKKDEIMIAVEQIKPGSVGFGNSSHLRTFKEKQPCYVSFEILDRNLIGIKSLIRAEDLQRIREHVALAQEGKTQYYKPDVVKKRWHFCSYCNVGDNGVEPDVDYNLNGLRFDKSFYHPNCLAESGFVNIDASEIGGYDDLDDDEKEHLDNKFEKNNEADPIFMASTKFSIEHCALKDCMYMTPIIEKKVLKRPKPTKYRPLRAILKGNLRIRYEHFSYHPECFALTGKVNVDGKDIQNYDILDESNKLILDKYFVRSTDFDTPLVEKATKDGYCNAVECSETPSKFPFPYNISIGQLQIGFKGDSYHPSCFEASGKINIDAKDIRNYESLTDEEKKTLDGLFKMKAQKRKSTEDQSNAEPSSPKKKRLSEDSSENGSESGETQNEINVVVGQEDVSFPISEAADNLQESAIDYSLILAVERSIQSFNEANGVNNNSQEIFVQ